MANCSGLEGNRLAKVLNLPLGSALTACPFRRQEAAAFRYPAFRPALVTDLKTLKYND
ncbi:MAG: hypothetical protein M9926_09980 [Lentimicrobium sp.]|uniref:hypothetical protein n=1 Tax=Lentimicrobium sp. TaxID=2034841 RepID=UPI0025ED3190|nr:hypothetical protein [Lentimicrobium sp.]MCO5257075.1 hypothetical protein [Lentimicrobium sp.]